jgi:antibiotic biosynthesis monooxygenase (ABM) superfamily enzyme
MNEKYVPPEIWNESNSREKLLKRMSSAYRRNKRKKKIEKLDGDSGLWKGLE